ncbi:MAG: hypothetical protein IJ286_04910 [Alistipes sp.]|nr:hypothetical protein [Alistipes sp.]
MKKFILIATALIAAVACDTDQNTNSWSKSIDGDMITVNTTTSVEYTDNATVTVEMKDITKPYFNLSIEGVKFVPMMPDVNFLISDIPFKIYASDDVNDPLYGSWVFSQESVVPTVGGVAREEYTMLNFKGSISDYGFVVEFDVNVAGAIYHAAFGKIDVVQTWEAAFDATATVTLNPGESATTSSDEFKISFAQANLSKQVVDITLEGLRFVEQMPEISMQLKNVPFSYSEDGAQRLFNVASIIPSVGGEQMAQYTISNLTGSVSKSAVVLDCDITTMNAHVSVAGSSK